jgi:hypothetical protein
MFAHSLDLEDTPIFNRDVKTTVEVTHLADCFDYLFHNLTSPFSFLDRALFSSQKLPLLLEPAGP